MKKYKKGTQFVVCSREELIKKGWEVRILKFQTQTTLYSDDFSELSISGYALQTYKGDTLTIDFESEIFRDWYWVEENCFRWPVATFLETTHHCIEGVTPINGWIICKTCGDNLREIK